MTPTEASDLISTAEICCQYRPGGGDIDRWRREFDRLAVERRRVERALIVGDQARLALMAAECARLAANAPDDALRVFFVEQAFHLINVARRDIFTAAGNFRGIEP